MQKSTDRRYRTAKKIQIAAVTLAVERGLSNITTEEISLAAKVSPRTFFNYYPYKEAALIGPGLDYPEEAVDAFVTAQNSLLEDLQQLVTLHLIRYLGQRDLLRNMLEITEKEPKFRTLMNSYTLLRREKMNDFLSRRLPDANPHMLYILSSAIIAAINDATRQWAFKKSDDYEQTVRDTLAMILPAAELLRQS